MNNSEEYPISCPGSAALLKYKERYFLVCTRHQLRKSAGKENVCVMIPDGNRTRCITSGGAVWWGDELDDGVQHDIVVFDFTEPCADLPEIRHLFFDFRGQISDVPADQVVGIIVYGYPTKIDSREYTEDHIVLTKCRVLCEYTGGDSDPAVHIIKPLTPLEFDPDGMSGGPAFCLLHDSSGFSIHLAGVTVQGSRSRLRLIKAGAIQMMLEARI